MMSLSQKVGVKWKLPIYTIDLCIGKGITGGRGVAGTVFVHKIAGAAAAEGLSLSEVADVARAVVPRVRSMGFALGMCALPGSSSSPRQVPPSTIEVGIGIHGEPGRQVQYPEGTPLAPWITEQALHTILPRLRPAPGAGVAVLINNLGGCAELETAVVARCVIRSLRNRGYRVGRCYVGSYMTSLEMAGVSVSLLDVTGTAAGEEERGWERLDRPTTAPAWRYTAPLPPAVAPPIPALPDPQLQGSPEGPLPVPRCLSPLLLGICAALIDGEALITEYDTACGDGDCGMAWSAGARGVVRYVQSHPTPPGDLCVFLQGLAQAVGESMGGTSGVLLEIWLRALGSWVALHREDIRAAGGEMQWPHWVAAVGSGVRAVSTYGGARVGMRTLLDALVPALEVWTGAVEQRGREGALSSPAAAELWDACARAARAGVEQTRTMEPAAGRANYIDPGRLKGVPDPGAHVVALIVDCMSRHLAEH